MIIGNGQLANAFKEFDDKEIVIFASGVADSNCIDEKQFERERLLLTSTLSKYNDKTFVYFSSCALSAKEYPLNDYYKHKKQMELLIKKTTENYYIFRIPQLFGKLKTHKTLINFIYNSIMNDEEFILYSDAYRYVIEMSDLVKLVNMYLQYHKPKITIDLANPYNYKVSEIVEIFEELLGKKSKYKILNKEDKYLLDLKAQNNFIEKYKIKVYFSKSYLRNKLLVLIKEIEGNQLNDKK